MNPSRKGSGMTKILTLNSYGVLLAILRVKSEHKVSKWSEEVIKGMKRKNVRESHLINIPKIPNPVRK